MERTKGSATILVVDDQPSVTKPARDLLEIFEHTVYVADSGEQALQCVRDRGDEIDLVIMDLKMPDMDGAECLNRIREIKPGVPAILATGYAMDPELEERLPADIQGHLSKPFTPDVFMRTIKEALGA